MAEIVSGIESAAFYASRGYFPIPAPYGEKGSRTPGWQNLRLTPSDPQLQIYFNGGKQNVGIILGDPHGLVDVDLDAPEARWAWMELGLETGFVFGRRSNPASHHFYFSNPPARTHPYDDPLPGERKKRLIELRGLGGFQLVPPSQHPSGEQYEFVHSGTPALIETSVLEDAVRNSAAAILIARHSPEGTRHDMFLALAGALARSGWHQEPTENLVRAVYRVLWRESAKLNDADREVADTYKKQAEGRDFTGLSTLRSHFEPKVFAVLTQWLGVHFDVGPAPEPPVGVFIAAAPAPAPTPEKETRRVEVPPSPISAQQLWNKVLPKPVHAVEDLVIQPGLSLVVAPSRSGKTLLAVQIAASIATGQDLFELKTVQSTVLMVEWDDEGGESSIQDILQRSRTARESMPFHLYPPYPPEKRKNRIVLSDPEFEPWLREQIQAFEAQLVVLDSYTTLRGMRLGGKDIVKLESDEIHMLSGLAYDLGCAILLIHHDSKSSANLDWSERGAGTFAITAGAESVIRIARFPDRPEQDTARLVNVRGRHLNDKEFVVRFQKETLDYDLVLDGPGSRDYPHLADLYRQFKGVPFTQKEASTELGWSKASAYRILARLIASGVLRKESTAFTWEPDFQPKGIL